MARIAKDRDAWNAIEAAVSAEPSARGLFHFSMGAWENASETEGVKFDSNDFYVCCFDSLGNMLAYSDDKAAVDFFVALGVTF